MSLPSLQSSLANKTSGKDFDFEVDDKDLNDILGLASSDEESSPKRQSRPSNLHLTMTLVCIHVHLKYIEYSLVEESKPEKMGLLGSSEGNSGGFIPSSKPFRPRPSTSTETKPKSNDGLFDPIRMSNTSFSFVGTSPRGSSGGPIGATTGPIESTGLFSRDREASKDLSGSHLPSNLVSDNKVIS